MNKENNTGGKKLNRRVIGLILAGLLIWTVVIVWGVVRNQPAFDFRKPLVILGVMGGFVFVWIALLGIRHRQK